MIKKQNIISLFLALAVFFSALSPGFAQESVAYNLPYPGILPGNPLYVVKEFRDKIWVFLTRDSLQKAELLLLLSDKKVSMALDLSDKGKWEDSTEQAIRAEELFTKMVDHLELAKKIGSSASPEFIQKTKLSNAKHLESLDVLYIKALPGEREKLEVLYDEIDLAKDRLEKL